MDITQTCQRDLVTGSSTCQYVGYGNYFADVVTGVSFFFMVAILVTVLIRKFV